MQNESPGVPSGAIGEELINIHFTAGPQPPAIPVPGMYPVSARRAGPMRYPTREE
jgi:hypothetical protein